MPIDPRLIEALLLEAEGNALDFKEAQYPFQDATDDQKSEILKDILSFTNAFRRTDAYILLGVKEEKGERGVVVGVSEQLEDAHLQQFVSSKTQRPVTFSYIATRHDGRPIGVIHIPIQPRPIYAARNFGKVQKGFVYHRRGSATAVATPEEIAQMGATDAISSETSAPELELVLVEPATHNVLGDSLTIQSSLLEIPSPADIPDYGESDRFGPIAVLRLEEPDYWRKLAKFTLANERVRPIRLAVKNVGSVAALDVRLVIDVLDPDKKYRFVDGADMPDVPVRNRPISFPTSRGILGLDVRAERRGDTWHVECEFGKIQPHAMAALGQDLFVGANESGSLDLDCKLFADNVGAPIRQTIKLSFAVIRRKVSLDEIEAIELARFVSSPGHWEVLEKNRNED